MSEKMRGSKKVFSFCPYLTNVSIIIMARNSNKGVSHNQICSDGYHWSTELEQQGGVDSSRSLVNGRTFPSLISGFRVLVIQTLATRGGEKMWKYYS